MKLGGAKLENEESDDSDLLYQALVQQTSLKEKETESRLKELLKRLCGYSDSAVNSAIQ